MDADSKNSLDASYRQEGPFEELSGTFTGVLICNDATCKRELAMAGDWGYFFDFDSFDGHGQPRLVDMCIPRCRS
jgi:hypothetical protein